MYIAKEEDEQTYGFDAITADSKFFVNNVHEGGPAWRAGVRAGDELKTLSLTLFEDRSSFEKWGASTIGKINSSSVPSICVQIRKSNDLPGVHKKRVLHLSRRKRWYDIDGSLKEPSKKKAPSFQALIISWDRRHIDELLQQLEDEIRGPQKRRRYDNVEPESEDQVHDDFITVEDRGIDRSPVASPSHSLVTSPVASPGHSLATSPVASPSHSLGTSPVASPSHSLVTSPVASPSHSLCQSPVSSLHDSSTVQLPAAMTLTVRQPHAPTSRYALHHGWFDTIERNQWLTDDIVSFNCHRYVQLFPYSKVRLLSPHLYQINFRDGILARWMGSLPEVVILPVCECNHWTLICIVFDTIVTVLYFDSKNPRNYVKPVCKAVYSTVKKMVGYPTKTVVEKAIAVPVQTNDHDCGIHVISHVASLAKALDSSTWKDISRDIQRWSFDTIISREELKLDMQDAMGECLYHRAYWCKWRYDDDSCNWWLCKRIGKRLASWLDKRSVASNLVPIFWFDKGKNDVMWVSRKSLIPIDDMTIDQVIAASNFDEEHLEMLHRSYASAVQS